MSFKPLRLVLAVCVIASATASLLPGQRLGPAPVRPALPAGLDTNDAEVYHDFAMDILDRDPKTAASAFYWAARIEPDYASALYGRRAALMLSNPEFLYNSLMARPNSKERRELLTLDSLTLRAFKINPFLYTRLDKRLMEAMIRESAMRSSPGRRGELTPATIELFTEQMIQAGGAQTSAWAAYNNGAFKRSLELYATALKKAKFKASILIERGRIFGILGEADSSVVAFRLAIDELRAKDKKDLVQLYYSTAVLEHSIGALYEHADFVEEARTAYGHAIQEDLSYYPAHVRLGVMSAAEGDTAAALSELSLAAQIAGDEPSVHFTLATYLARFGKTTEALDELNKAILLEPLYARPYPLLVELLEKNGDHARALAACQRFLQIASQRHVDRKAMIEKRAEITLRVGNGLPL